MCITLLRRGAAALCLAAGLSVQPAGASADIVLRAAAAARTGSDWTVVADPTAAGGSRLANVDRRAPKRTVALAAPGSYAELTFEAEAATPYRLWMRGTAHGDRYDNDSAFVQFSDSVTAAGAPTWRIGTTSSTTYVLENGSGAGLSGWGWQDNGYDAAGPLVYFAATGTHTIRIQVREDGLSLDQIVLSPAAYLTDAPGTTKNDTTILTGDTTPPSISLVREPYLHQVTEHSAVIVWASREPGPASVVVGGHTVTAASVFHPAASTGMGYDYYQHAAAVSGLAAATTYGYDVYVGGTRATPGSDVFRTAPATGSGRVRFAIIGDSGTGSPEQRALATLLAGASIDLMLHSGDLAYGSGGGTGDASHTTIQSWFFDVYRDLLRRRPIFPATGNHDARASNGWGRAYLDAFVLPEDAGAGAYPDHAERYYSFDYGPVHFVALDTELAFTAGARRAAQLAWLDADLAATTQPWKVAFFHKAPYSTLGEHGSNLDVRQAFAPLFERHGVQLALSSHEHDYERLVPWRESAASTQAVINVVSGGGGAPLYPSGQSEWTALSRSVHHYLEVTIEGCVAALRAIDTAGRAFDASQFDRCAQAGDAAAPTVSFAAPSAAATVSGSVTITADASDDTRVEKVDLWIDGVLRGIDLTAPYAFTWDSAGESAGAHTLELRAYDLAGRRAAVTRDVTVQPAPGGAGDIVIHAADVPPSAIVGDWALAPDATAADGVALRNPNRRAAKMVATTPPVSYFDVTFEAAADTPYHLWLRLRAEGNDYANDSVYVWFDGEATGRSVILEEGSGGGVRGWGWNDNSYGGLAAPITFSTGGAHTLRVGVREDGVSVDQIVLSPGTYLTTRPGAIKDDATIVPR